MNAEAENTNEPQDQTLLIADVSGSIKLGEQRRIMFKFDNDEPVHLNTIFSGGKFTIELKEGSIKFENGGKIFELYVE